MTGEMNPKDKDAKIVSLKEIVEPDSSLIFLADLPLGWTATRQDVSSPWVRSKR